MFVGYAVKNTRRSGILPGPKAEVFIGHLGEAFATMTHDALVKRSSQQ